MFSPPLATSAMRKNNVHKTKTDKVDTFVIAKTLMNAAHNVVRNNATCQGHLEDAH